MSARGKPRLFFQNLTENIYSKIKSRYATVNRLQFSRSVLIYAPLLWIEEQKAAGETLMEINQLTAELTRQIGYKPSKYQIGILEWVLNGKGNGACNAVAGAGKSSTLQMVAIALELIAYKPSDIRVIVFGKENSKDLINKFGVRWSSSISTLHSAGFSLLRKDLNIKDNRDIQLSDGKYKRIAQDLDLIGKRGSRGKLHSCGAVGKDSEFLRLLGLVRLTNNYPTDAMCRDLCHHFEVEDIYEYSIVASAIADCLRIGEQKAKNNRFIDFTDQVWLPVKWEIYKRQWFKSYKFVLVDECQDLNSVQLELAIGLAGLNGRLLFVGDPCQPTDTKVLVVRKRPRGRHKIATEEIPIQDIKVGETVYAYSAQDGHFYSSVKVAGITKRPFDGELVVVELPSGQKSRYTLNHHCIASFTAFRNHYCVYLMQKGNQFRVGMSKVAISENSGSGPVYRLRQENADAMWILEFYSTRDEAFTMEQAISGKFGLPQLVFSDTPIKTKGLLDRAWEFIGNNFERAVACLTYFGRDIRYPLFKAGRSWQQSLKRPMVVQASNLVAGCLMLPFSNKQQTYSQDWQPARVTREKYTGDVYSLDVEKYHTYIADGIVTHNCQAIMGFAGADNRSYQKILSRTKATELPLSTCYRCPRSHIDLVRRQFPNIPIEAKEDACDGKIHCIEEKDLPEHLRPGDRVISRKIAPLVSQCIKLIARGTAAAVKGRDIGEAIKRDLEEIASMPGFKYEDFHAYLNEYRSLKTLKYKEMDNEEQLIQNLNDKLEALQVIYISLPQALGIADLSTYIDSLFSDDVFPVIFSSCHRGKGVEGNRIFILRPEDMPMTWRNQLEWQKEQEDNLLYVALTRSKSELFIVGQPDWLPTEKGLQHTGDSLQVLTDYECFSCEDGFYLATPEGATCNACGDSSEWTYLNTKPEFACKNCGYIHIICMEESSKCPRCNKSEFERYPEWHGEEFASSEVVAKNNNPAVSQDLSTPTGNSQNTAGLLFSRQNYKDNNSDTALALAPDEPTIPEYEEGLEDYTDWMPELPLLDDDELTRENLHTEEAPHIVEQVRKRAHLASMDADEQEELATIAPVEEVALMGEAAQALNPSSVNSLQSLPAPKTNAEKRERVIQVLKHKEWQGKSDRAIAKYCNVSAPFVGKVRAELEAEGTVNVSPTRVDSKGRKIDTANIGTKPLQPQVGLEYSDKKIEATVTKDPALEQTDNSKTRLPQFFQAQLPLEASNSPVRIIQAKLRIEGETKEDLDAIALLLQQNLEIVEESRDYHNHNGIGYRRYLIVKVSSYNSIDIP